MAAFWDQYSQWVFIFLYLIANEIVLHNPKLVAGSIPNLIWNALKGTVVGKPTPPLP